MVIARALNINWRKTNGTSWKGDDISAIRNEGKFSEKLKSLVWANTNPEGPQWTKPIFGRVLAETCTPEEIPKEICNIFKLARILSGAVPLNNNSSEDP